MKTRNPIIQQMISGGDVSDSAAKKIYHQLSKVLHPDTGSGSAEEFSRLQIYYEEARAYILADNVITTNAARQKTQDRKYIRYRLFHFLDRYQRANLHSAKIRLRESMQRRNEVIMKPLYEWARQYSIDFYRNFSDYNQFNLDALTETSIHRQFRRYKTRFINAMAAFLDFQRHGRQIQKRIAKSFFEDLTELPRIHPMCDTIDALSQWFIKELEQESAGV